MDVKFVNIAWSVVSHWQQLNFSSSSCSLSSWSINSFRVAVPGQDSYRWMMHLLLSVLQMIFLIRSLYVKSYSSASTSNTTFSFHSPKEFSSPNLYISWANMWCPDYQNKKRSLGILSSFKVSHLCIKWAIMCCPDSQIRKKLNLCMQANKNILCKEQIRIQNMYQQVKYEKLNISAKGAVARLLKFY